jgi:hypothetical protein
MNRWLENVSRLSYPADLLLVDNSPGTQYVERVKNYCIKYELDPKRTQIKHVEIVQKLTQKKRWALAIEISQEIIRQEVLSGNYDAWFSWECDQIIPLNSLDRLIEIMQKCKSTMVVHTSHNRIDPSQFEADMGVTLTKAEILKNVQFLPTRNGKISQDLRDMENSSMLKEKVLSAGGNYVELYGVISPIYHLNK